jgi:hypothetical protein
VAKLIGKGTNLQVTISSVLTTVAQVTDFTVGAQDPEVFESRTLDGGVAVEKQATGYTAQGDITGSLFLDTSNATHQFIATNSQAPGTTIAGKVILSDSAELTFTAAVIGMGDTAVSMSDGLKSSFTIKTEGLVTYPTS